MSYETGSVNTLADLLSAIRNACTAHGWTLSGSVLHKGDAYIRSGINAGFIEWLGGTGKDGSNALTGAAPQVVRTGDFQRQALSFPCTWEAHILTDPDEVYIVLNYNVDYYQYIAWGLSSVEDLPGTGMWFGASRLATGGGESLDYDFDMELTNLSLTNFGSTGGALFYAQDVFGNAQTSYIHHGLDGGGWSGHAYNTPSTLPRSFGAVVQLLKQLPNAWNNQMVLLPFPVYLPRTSGNKTSLVADLAHIRHCRIDFHAPGEIITLGSDQWKVYPWYRKNIAQRGGHNNTGIKTHSGTVGFAVRYTGS